MREETDRQTDRAIQGGADEAAKSFGMLKEIKQPSRLVNEEGSKKAAIADVEDLFFNPFQSNCRIGSFGWVGHDEMTYLSRYLGFLTLHSLLDQPTVGTVAPSFEIR